jgi:hypothetical protein
MWTDCDRAKVADTFRGKRVAIVGSGPGVLDNEPGFVDSHDVVVRINNFKTGPNAGFRTDVFYSFFGASIRKPREQLEDVRLCICKCPDAKFIESPWHERNGKHHGVDFRYIYEARKNWWFCDTYIPPVHEFMQIFMALDGHIPTTGFSAIETVLSCAPAEVYLTGFDFFQSGVHNVNERWKAGDPNDPIGHRPDLERRWLLDWAGAFNLTMDKIAQSAMLGKVRPHMAPAPHKRRRRLALA